MTKILEETIEETERFLKKLKLFEPNNALEFSSDKNRAAVKRSSMDLSRQLTALRQARSHEWK